MARQPAEARHHSRKLTVRQYPPSAGTLPEFGQQGGRSASIDDTLPPAGNPEVSPEGMTLVLSHEGKPSSPERTALAHAHRTRTTRLLTRGGRLHRPGDPRAGPRDADVTGRATGSVGHRTGASRGETTAGPRLLRPCAGTIASTTAASSCRLCLCHERDRRHQRPRRYRFGDQAQLCDQAVLDADE